MKKNPSIWVNCLVKNEERWLWFALQSVLAFVDKILVWDSGSTDKTEKIIKTIKSKKINFQQIGSISKKDYGKIRQRMLEQTKSDWVFILDGDEIWPKKCLQKLLDEAKKAPKHLQSFSFRPINFVGDIRFIHPEVFLGQTPYGPKGLKGFFADHLFRRCLPGLHIKGVYGQEGFYDKANLSLRERKSHHRFLPDVYYWHMSYLPRSSSRKKDLEVMMRWRKRKYEIGLPRPDWIEFPEVFYLKRPNLVADPFYKMNNWEYLKAMAQTPLKKIKRKLTGWKND
jgi:glycosyltransferase involved in cell wall biosynthesis